MSTVSQRLEETTSELLCRFEAFIRRDPAQRGLISSEPLWGPLCPGHLAGAARSLATAQSVAIVTGFFIPSANPPAAETDGPPGACLLARVLHDLGISVTVVTDRFCASAVRATAAAFGLPAESVMILELEHQQGAGGESSPALLDLAPFWESDCGRTLTHLVSIERIGPSHTSDSHRFPCEGELEAAGRENLVSFESALPDSHRNCCHNMRGIILDDVSPPLWQLFEPASLSRASGPVVTIGIGDGGNEIGMGAIPWSELRRRLSGEHAGWVPCRIACDWNIVAGTSNWGGFALGAAVAMLRQKAELISRYDRAWMEGMLSQIVREGPAVDGVTRCFEPTVDGLPLLTFLQPWEAILRAASGGCLGLSVL